MGLFFCFVEQLEGVAIGNQLDHLAALAFIRKMRIVWSFIYL